MSTNNVIRLLNSRKIQVQIFTLPPEKLGAQRTAEILNVPIQQVFKTIVLKKLQPRKYILALIPGDQSADLKAVARVMNEKKVILPTEQEAEQITGLQAGGISPLALLKPGFQVLADESIFDFEAIHISAGERGSNLKIGVRDLISLTNAKTAAISLTLTED